MIEENELILFILGLVSFIFILMNHSKLKEIPSINYFLVFLSLILVAWFSTVIEAVIFYEFLNGLEHICYFFSSLVFLVWIILLLKSRRRTSDDRN